MEEVAVGVVAVFSGPVAVEAGTLADLLSRWYGTSGTESCPWPHVTFQGGMCSDLARLQQAISTLAGKFAPVEAEVDGIGYFDPPSNVVYLRVTPTAEMRALNHAADATLRSECSEVWDYYTPENWVPHVTVAWEDLLDEDIMRAKEDLHGYHPKAQERITGLTLLVLDPETKTWQITRTFPLGGV